MKKLMEIFHRQTSQRFHEYDERMKDMRQKCKEQCDEDIQKIILKDKIEKQMEEYFSALETKIDTNDIPTCVCEKTLADKVEKTCLKCTQNLGGIVAPSSVVLGGIGELAISVWKPKAIAAAIAAAEKAGEAKGVAEGAAVGLVKFIEGIKSTFFINKLGGTSFQTFFNKTHYTNVAEIANVIYNQYEATCTSTLTSTSTDAMCEIGNTLKLFPQPGQEVFSTEEIIGTTVKGIFTKADEAAALKASEVSSKTTAKIITEQTGVIDGICSGSNTAIIASIITILFIVLIMIIIYLILRYRRKKKMKKKHQYIKLLTK